MTDRDHHKTIQHLIDMFGQQECLRLGFLAEDDNKTLYLAPMGMGYLLDVVAGEIESTHEAYAAGYEQGREQAKE